MNNNKEFLPSGYSAEDVARINAIDLSDPNSIAAINSIDNTISKLNSRDNTIAKLNSHTIGYVEVPPEIIVS
jgi:hypothetical protein